MDWKKRFKTENPDQFYNAGEAHRYFSPREQLVLLKDRLHELHDYPAKLAKATSHVYLSATSHISLSSWKETTHTQSNSMKVSLL